jgi:DNA repair photolyase
MKINIIKCKTALSKSNLPGLEYSLNPYRGCQHNCCYCYVPNVLKIERKNWGSFVDVKKNIPVVLSNELKNKKQGIVGISTVTDPYQPIEDKYNLTKYCLEQLIIHDFPVNIQTKSDLVTRDINIISKFNDIEVMFSIGTINDSERKILEPFSSPIQKRLEAMKKISDTGIKTSVFFGPIYPTIKKEDLTDILNTFVEFGAKEIMVDKFNLKPGILEVLEKKIPENINKIKNTYFFKEIYEEINRICSKEKIKAVSAF